MSKKLKSVDKSCIGCPVIWQTFNGKTYNNNMGILEHIDKGIERDYFYIKGIFGTFSKDNVKRCQDVIYGDEDD